MLAINPINSLNICYGTKTRKTGNRNNNITFKSNKDIIISRNSMKIIDSIFTKMLEAKDELKNMIINKNGFEVTYKSSHEINTEMRKYNKETDTLLRLQEAVNGTALKVHIDRFSNDEKIRFFVQIEDLKENENTILMRRGTVTDFKWDDNFTDRSGETDKIDEIIEKYLKH